MSDYHLQQNACIISQFQIPKVILESSVKDMRKSIEYVVDSRYPFLLMFFI